MFYLVIMFFFFFKQKTAYEMAQCDWSSDVCSSDLLPPWLIPPRRLALEANSPRDVYALAPDARMAAGCHPGCETAMPRPLQAYVQRDQSCTPCPPPPSSCGWFWPLAQDHGLESGLQGSLAVSESPCHRHSPRTRRLPAR